MYTLCRVTKFVGGQYTGQNYPQQLNGCLNFYCMLSYYRDPVGMKNQMFVVGISFRKIKN